jgi:hypothetical protein
MHEALCLDEALGPSGCYYICTRPEHHDGPHVAHAPSGATVAEWERSARPEEASMTRRQIDDARSYLVTAVQTATGRDILRGLFPDEAPAIIATLDGGSDDTTAAVAALTARELRRRYGL